MNFGLRLGVVVDRGGTGGVGSTMGFRGAITGLTTREGSERHSVIKASSV